MRGVNLSRRPFVNRRPVMRMVVILWVLAGVLVLANLRLFTGYLAESYDIRGKIEEADQDLREKLDGLAQLDSQIARISLGAHNRQALFLNSLISYRTFPWSALFDDLEKVLPPRVRLLSVRPVLRLASEEAVSQAEAQARSEARQRSRRRRSRGAQATNASDDLGRGDSITQPEDGPQAQDEVRLELNCIAEDEESLITFLETLYESTGFRRPLLRNESYSGQQVSFSLVVLYRTGKRFDLEPEEGEPASEGPSPQVAEETTEQSGGNGAVAPTPADDVVAETPSTPSPQTQPAPLQPSRPATPPPTDDERRTRQLDEEVAAARRAAGERANAEERLQNEAETDRATVIDQRRQRLEELRRRARERRENEGADGGRSSALVLTPGSQRGNPPRTGNQGNTTRPSGTGGARRPPTSRNPSLEDDPPPTRPNTPASGTPRIGGMASLHPVSIETAPWEARA